MHTLFVLIAFVLSLMGYDTTAPALEPVLSPGTSVPAPVAGTDLIYVACSRGHCRFGIVPRVDAQPAADKNGTLPRGR